MLLTHVSILLMTGGGCILFGQGEVKEMKKIGIPTFVLVAGAWVIWAAGFQEAAPVERQPVVLDRAPVRIIEDLFPVFNGITMDVERGELIVAKYPLTRRKTNGPQQSSINEFAA